MSLLHPFKAPIFTQIFLKKLYYNNGYIYLLVLETHMHCGPLVPLASPLLWSQITFRVDCVRVLAPVYCRVDYILMSKLMHGVYSSAKHEE